MTEEQRRWLLIHLNNNRGGGTNSGGGVTQSIVAEGGTVTRDGDYIVRTFLAGTFDLNITSNLGNYPLTFLAVGGGGCGGATDNGGAGGGGLSPGNKTGLWYYEETIDIWIKMPDSPLSRHGSSLCTDGANKMFIVSGNTRNDVIRITKTTL